MKKLVLWYFNLDNAYYKFLPFLFLYFLICIKLAPPDFVDDEARYVRFANNILNGFYSPPFPNIDLWNGPGYPLIIAPFLLLKLPLMVIRLLNGAMLYLSLIAVYKTICIYSSKNIASFASILLGLYFPIFEKLPLIVTEITAWLLISITGYLFIKIGNQKSFFWKDILLCGFTIGLLTLVKVVFGYVIFSLLATAAILFLLPKFRLLGRKFIAIFAFAFLLCVPYLIYTYSLTHKALYWTNSGGWSLYTMSAPYPNDWGDWKDNPQMLANPNYKVFVDSVQKLSSFDRDAAYKAKAIENIKAHPKKYLLNGVANLGRMFFSYPFTDEKQDVKTYYTILPNMFVLVLMIFSLIIGAIYYKKLPEALILMLLFILIYLAGSTLVSAFRRMFYITMPFWTIFIAYVFTNIITIRFKKD